MTHLRSIAAGTSLAAAVVVATALVAVAAPPEHVPIGGAPAYGAARPSPSPGVPALPAASTVRVETPFNGGHQRQVNVGAKGFGAGDMFLLTGAPVREQATGHRIGTFDGQETVVSGAHNGTVTQLYTLRLATGTLTLAGVIRHSDPHPTLAITGGTGAYVGAGGQLIEIREDNVRKVTILDLEILHDGVAALRADPNPVPAGGCASQLRHLTIALRTAGLSGQASHVAAEIIRGC